MTCMRRRDEIDRSGERSARPVSEQSRTVEMGRTRRRVCTPSANAGIDRPARHEVEPSAMSRRSPSVHDDSSEPSSRSSRKSGLSADVIVARTGSHTSLSSVSQPDTRMSTSNLSKGEPPVQPMLTFAGASTARNSMSLSKGRSVLPDTVDQASG